MAIVGSDAPAFHDEYTVLQPMITPNTFGRESHLRVGLAMGLHLCRGRRERAADRAQRRYEFNCAHVPRKPRAEFASATPAIGRSVGKRPTRARELYPKPVKCRRSSANSRMRRQANRFANPKALRLIRVFSRDTFRADGQPPIRALCLASTAIYGKFNFESC